MNRDRQLREQLVGLLRGGNAHLPFAEAAADFPAARINVRPPNVDYTFWHLIEHLRITQADILAYLTRRLPGAGMAAGVLASSGCPSHKARMG